MRRASSVLGLIAVCLVNACGSSSVGVTPSPSPAPAPTTPVARGYSWLVDASGDGGVYLFGGFTGPPRKNGKWVPDLWSFRYGQGWQLVAGSADQLPTGDGVGYDLHSSKPIFLDDSGVTWTFETGTWKQIGTGGPQLHGIHLAYDSKADRLLTFGGDHIFTDGAFFDDTWVYEPEAAKWTKRHPALSPPARSYYAMAYDAKADRLVLFGGEDVSHGAYFADTWVYSSGTNQWTQMRPRESPPARDYSVMAYDSVRDRILLFGGATSTETPFDDLWAYDLGRDTWSQLKPTGPRPTARAWHAMAFDEETGMLVLFGGGRTRDAYTNEVWTLDPRTDAWSRGA
jgi:N-acetylneuraminic acid mutarotase